MSIKSDSSRWGLVMLVWLAVAGIIITGVWFFKFRTDEELEESTSSQSRYKHEVRMNADWFSGYCIFRSDQLKSQLRSRGIKLVYEDDSADYEARLKALQNDKIDLAPFPVNSLIEMCEKMKISPATIVMFIDETRGADAIVAYKDAVENLDDLNDNDARFVLTPGSPSEYLARVVKADLDMSNLPDKWTVPADGAGEVYEKFRKGSKTQPAAYVLWEPYVTKALKNSEAHVIFGSDKLKGHIVDALVVRRKYLKENPDVVKQIIESYLRVCYTLHKDNGMIDLVRRDAKNAGERLGEDEARNVVAGIQWKNTLENYAHFRMLSRHESQGLEDVEDIIEKITRVLLVTEALPDAKIESHTFFYNNILAELQAADFHPGRKIGLIAGDGDTGIDRIRADVKLPELSEAQWSKLIAVGKMRIKQLSFRRGTADLNIQSRRNLDELAAKLESMPQYYLKVIGHTRSEGDLEANLRLAQSRAQAAVQYLAQRKGVPHNRLNAIAAKPSGGGGSSQSVTFQLAQRAY